MAGKSFLPKQFIRSFLAHCCSRRVPLVEQELLTIPGHLSVVISLCFSSSWVPHVASFSGLSIFVIASSVFSNVYLHSGFVEVVTWYIRSLVLEGNGPNVPSGPKSGARFSERFSLSLSFRYLRVARWAFYVVVCGYVYHHCCSLCHVIVAILNTRSTLKLSRLSVFKPAKLLNASPGSG